MDVFQANKSFSKAKERNRERERESKKENHKKSSIFILSCPLYLRIVS